MSIKKVYLFSIVLVLSLININSLIAQYEPINSIHILQQPILEEADSNVVLEYGYGWLDGYNVIYKCMITKADSLDLNSILLSVINEYDTLLINNYSNISDDINLHIINNGEIALLTIDTLPYSSDYTFSLQLYESDSLLQEINYIETFN